MIWFSSDFHLSHTNIAGKEISSWDDGYRNFKSIEEMNKTIITAINKYVKEEDVLYFLGDFAFKDHTKIPYLRSLINCQTIHFIRGNHDEHIDKYSNCFTSINDVITLNIGKQKVFLSHYSHRIWLGSHKGFIHLYGHSHGNIINFGKSMDVGIDVAYRLFKEYRPFSATEIIDIMAKRSISFVDNYEKKQMYIKK